MLPLQSHGTPSSEEELRAGCFEIALLCCYCIALINNSLFLGNALIALYVQPLKAGFTPSGAGCGFQGLLVEGLKQQSQLRTYV